MARFSAANAVALILILFTCACAGFVLALKGQSYYTACLAAIAHQSGRVYRLAFGRPWSGSSAKAIRLEPLLCTQTSIVCVAAGGDSAFEARKWTLSSLYSTRQGASSPAEVQAAHMAGPAAEEGLQQVRQELQDVQRQLQDRLAQQQQPAAEEELQQVRQELQDAQRQLQDRLAQQQQPAAEEELQQVRQELQDAQRQLQERPIQQQQWAALQAPERMIIVSRLHEDVTWLDTHFGDIPRMVYQLVPDLTKHEEICPPGKIAARRVARIDAVSCVALR